MMLKRVKDITGRKFGRMEVVRHRGSDPSSRQALWECKCECGTVKVVRGSLLRNGSIQSCGCYNADQKRTHGMEGTKIYNVWASMKQRCQNPKHRAYSNYGGRGITVCDAWQRFEDFYSDMGEPPESEERLTLERIDNNAGYCPENCKWATYREQLANRRKSVKTFLDGETK